MDIRVHQFDIKSLKTDFNIDEDKLINYLVEICGNINPEYFKGIIEEKIGMDNLFLLIAFRTDTHIRFTNFNPFAGFALVTIEEDYTKVHLICGKGTGSLLFREIALTSQQIGKETIKLDSLMEPLPIYIKKYGFKPTKKNEVAQTARQMFVNGEIDVNTLIDALDPNSIYEENGVPLKVRVTRILARTTPKTQLQ
jgi:hypothetical protein